MLITLLVGLFGGIGIICWKLGAMNVRLEQAEENIKLGEKMRGILRQDLNDQHSATTQQIMETLQWLVSGQARIESKMDLSQSCPELRRERVNPSKGRSKTTAMTAREQGQGKTDVQPVDNAKKPC